HGRTGGVFVVNAGGIWAHELGRLGGVEIPVVPMEHQYLITRPIDGVTASFPTLRHPDNLVYAREEVGGRGVGVPGGASAPRTPGPPTRLSRKTSTTGCGGKSGSGASRSRRVRST